MSVNTMIWAADKARFGDNIYLPAISGDSFEYIPQFDNTIFHYGCYDS